MTKKHIMYVIVVGGLVSGAFSAALFSHKGNAPISSGSSRSGSNSTHLNDSTALSWSDPTLLVGHNTEVFVGKVIQQVGNDKYPSTGTTSTQFEVRVIYNIKGNLQGAVTLAQFDVGSWAQVGSTYMFAVQYRTDTGWYIFGAEESYQLLTDNANLSDTELKALAENSPEVLALQKAYPNEQLNPVDVVNQATYNSYASRHYDAAGQLIDDTVVLHEQYMAAHPSAAANPPAADNSVPANAPAGPAVSPTTDNTPQSNTSAESPVPSSSDTPVPAAS